MAVHLQVAPRGGLLDEPLVASVEGLPPGGAVTVGAAAVDSAGVAWQSALRCRADTDGAVRIGQRPVADPDTSSDGASVTTSPSALLWAMAPQRAVSGPFQVPDVLRLRITVRRDNRVLCVEDAERLVAAPAVRCLPIRSDHVAGTLYLPRRDTPAPAVIVLGGSGGVAPRATAALLASHGFIALAQSYFGPPPLTPVLEEVPVELVAAATRLLRRHPQASGRVGVLGTSKGAELALLAATMIPEISAVVAYAPSAVAFAGFGGDGTLLRASWSQGGRPVPFARWDTPIDRWRARFAAGVPVPLAPLYAEALTDAAQVQLAAIPVERVRGPLLLVAGQDDQMWPSRRSVDLIRARLARHAHGFEARCLCYPRAGHGIGLPGRPTTVRGVHNDGLRAWLSFGGTAAGDAAASAHAWAQVLSFLTRHLHYGSSRTTSAGGEPPGDHGPTAE